MEAASRRLRQIQSIIAASVDLAPQPSPYDHLIANITNKSSSMSSPSSSSPTSTSPTSTTTSTSTSTPSSDPSHWTQVLILPSGPKCSVSVQPNGTTRIAMDDRRILDYRPLNPRKQLALVLSALGTPHEGSSPEPKYEVLELTAPDDVNVEVNFVDFWVGVYVLWTLFHTQEHIPFVLHASIANRDTAAVTATGSASLTHDVLLSGLARTALDPKVHELFLLRNTFWQGAGTGPLWSNPHGWVRGIYGARAASYPHTLSFTRTPLVISQHPLRCPKPAPGEPIYIRHCVGVNKILTVVAIDVNSDEHLQVFHRWHNDDLVNKGWGEKGSLEDHRRYIRSVWEDPHVLPVYMLWDGEYMGYCEIVWIKENHCSTYIPGGPHEYDRGLHVLVGEEKYRGPTYSQAWFRSVSHYMFLADHRTYRIIGEPKRSNPGVVKLSLDAGMHLDTHFYFPYKQSVLTVNNRERVFKEDFLH